MGSRQREGGIFICHFFVVLIERILRFVWPFLEASCNKIKLIWVHGHEISKKKVLVIHVSCWKVFSVFVTSVLVGLRWGLNNCNPVPLLFLLHPYCFMLAFVLFFLTGSHTMYGRNLGIICQILDRFIFCHRLRFWWSISY